MWDTFANDFVCKILDRPRKEPIQDLNGTYVLNES